MTDFHTHILPKMDDGSHSAEESIAMLKMLSVQGINRVVATPHFYANDESVSEFLSRRQAAYERLKELMSPEMPSVFLGAEVRYYEGISRLSELKSLCIQGSQLLLLEMPMGKWTEYTLRELIDISCGSKLTLALAHVERYMNFQQAGAIERLLQNGVLMQINASFVCDFFSRRKALAMLKKQEVHLLGSDCHNMSDRQPNIGKAFEIIQKKFGKDFADGFIEYGNNFFE